MKTKSLNGMGFKGINSDLAPWDLPPEFITDGRNFRIDGNRITSKLNQRTLATPSVDPNAGHLVFVHSVGGDFFLILGSGAGANRCQSWDGATFNDISSAAGAYAGITDPSEWSSCMLGKIPIVNHVQHYPEYWNPQQATTLLTPMEFSSGVTFATQGIQFKVIRSYQNFLFALNLKESGVEQPNAFRWSHPAAINSMPVTWDETDAAYIAGKGQVGGQTGQLIDGRTMRDSFALYSEFGVTLLDPSGDELVWRVRPLSESYGVINDKMIQEVKGTHFFMSDGDVLMNDGNTIQSIADDVILKRLRANINADYFLHGYTIRDTGNKEIWFCVPEGSAQYPSVAYVYSWEEQKWSIRDIPYEEDGAGGWNQLMIHGTYGVRPVEQITWDMFDATTGTVPYKGMTWAGSGTLTWSGSTQSPLNLQPIGLEFALGGALIEMDPSVSGGGDTDFQIERTDIVLETQDQVCTITRIYPHMTGGDDVTIQIGCQAFAGAPVDWEAAVTYNPNTDRKVDVRCTGSLFAYRVSSVGTGAVSISGLTVEYELAGRR